MQKSARIFNNCTCARGSILWVCPNSFVRIHHRVVCTRAFMCVRWCDRDLTSREARRKVMKRDSLRRLEIERCSRSRRSRMRFFARARSRGLSRSQPVFVIIMLEKCMNICFINASSYFISFYDKKKKEKWNRTSRDSLIPCNIYIYTYIYYIYLVYYSILRPLLLTILASLPASLVFNLLSFGIYSTQCLYRNYFLFNPFSLNFLLLLFPLGVTSRCSRTLRSMRRHADRNFPLIRYTYVNFDVFFFSPRILLNRVSLHSVACPWRNSCRRCIIDRLRIVAELIFLRSATFLHSPRARELRQARESS